MWNGFVSKTVVFLKSLCLVEAVVAKMCIGKLHTAVSVVQELTHSFLQREHYPDTFCLG